MCNGGSCPNGCCSGTTCIPFPSQSPGECGSGGVGCGSCANDLCDTTNGTCSCDSNTCPGACCNSGTGGSCTAQTVHDNGVGENFDDCNPLDTYTAQTAVEACSAFLTTVSGGTPNCSPGWTCTDLGGAYPFACFSDDGGQTSEYYCWGYGDGAGVVIDATNCDTQVASWD